MNWIQIVPLVFSWSYVLSQKYEPTPVDKIQQFVLKYGESQRTSSRPLPNTLSTVQLIQHWGFPAEEHQVTTKDGYILTIHRIPGKGRPIFLQHGFAASSDHWVLRSPDKDIAFLLANRTYDVWLGNCRGNFYSKAHVNLPTRSSSEAYWSFSFHEMGVFDLPAAWDYILGVTGHSELFYIGHSMGTTMVAVALSELPEYNKNLRAVILMAPVIVPTFKDPLLQALVGRAPRIADAFRKRKIYEVFPRTETSAIMGLNYCSSSAPFEMQRLCAGFYMQLFGADFDQLDPKILPVFFGHFPSGASVQTAEHFAQLAASGGDFHKFDYRNITRNQQAYNQAQSPEYDLRKVTAPVLLYYATNDRLAPPQDIARLKGALPNVAREYLVPFPLFNHADFQMAKDSVKLLSEDILKALDTFGGPT